MSELDELVPGTLCHITMQRLVWSGYGQYREITHRVRSEKECAIVVSRVKSVMGDHWYYVVGNDFLGWIQGTVGLMPLVSGGLGLKT